MTPSPMPPSPATPPITTHTPAFTLRPADRRGQTSIGWLHSRHSFAFGRYHDPADPHNQGYHGLRVINDDIVQPGQGFGEHGHDNMEILTWVLDGQLKHGDSLGHMQTLRPGELQMMSAGRGIRHSEFNASASEPVHFLQVWIEPAHRDIEPAYRQAAFDPAARVNQWQVLTTGRDADATGESMTLDRDATLRVADLQPGHSLQLNNPPGRHAYAHVATGSVQLGEHTLQPGDAFHLENHHTLTLRTTDEPAQLLWFDLS